MANIQLTRSPKLMKEMGKDREGEIDGLGGKGS